MSLRKLVLILLMVQCPMSLALLELPGSTPFLDNAQLVSVADAQLPTILDGHHLNLVEGSVKVATSNSWKLIYIKPMDDLFALVLSGSAKRTEFYNVSFQASDSAGKRFSGSLLMQVNDVNALLPPDSVQQGIAITEKHGPDVEMQQDAPWVKSDNSGHWFQVFLSSGIDDDIGGVQFLKDPTTELSLKQDN